ncbi:MAG: hypothetical protein E7266_02490 [Lachnospiraceae bacterium]|nr:hypothetical protein [Lachnospiraceae bacterium]
MKVSSLVKVRRKKIVPVFFACDDKYTIYMMVTMKSLIENASPDRNYRLHVLHTDITYKNQMIVKSLETENCKIEFNDVREQMLKIEKKISLRDYYSSATYYRAFIAEMFPQYEKVAYIDSDTVLLKDIAKFYDYDLQDNYIAGIRDQIVSQVDVYGEYVEKVLGISREAYFNAGVVLINCKQFRKEKVLDKFVDLLNLYSFVVAQDQDYLNIICKNKVLWIDGKWNVQMVGNPFCDEKDYALIHYNLAAKPWHYKDCRNAEYFWKYAKMTPGYKQLMNVLENFTEEDASKDEKYGKNLYNLAIEETNKEDNFYNVFGDLSGRSTSRITILKKIEQYEKEGRFDEDVEDDPPAPVLMPEDIDYLHKSIKDKLKRQYAYRMAGWFLNTLIRKHQFIIKDIKGIENYQNLKTGAIITCNHFSPLDSFAMHITYKKANHSRNRRFYRIIKEGNYTGFPGFYGLLMRNCDTLPLSSNKTTMKKFMKAVDKLLQKGNFVLIYPEQSMWWNYRKPKPIKKGGFIFAVNNNVPVLPCFITMEDSQYKDGEGFPVQKYTIHVSAPIYPDKNKTRAENIKEMMEKHTEVWKNIYEETYGVPLTYTCDEE